MINGRQEDLSRVFDKTWSAKHNDVAKRGREKEKSFMNKMFNTSNNMGSIDNRNLTPGQRAETLHNKMNSAFQGQRQGNLNNIMKKWK